MNHASRRRLARAFLPVGVLMIALLHEDARAQVRAMPLPGRAQAGMPPLDSISRVVSRRPAGPIALTVRRSPVVVSISVDLSNSYDSLQLYAIPPASIGSRAAGRRLLSVPKLDIIGTVIPGTRPLVCAGVQNNGRCPGQWTVLDQSQLAPGEALLVRGYGFRTAASAPGQWDLHETLIPDTYIAPANPPAVRFLGYDRARETVTLQWEAPGGSSHDLVFGPGLPATGARTTSLLGVGGTAACSARGRAAPPNVGFQEQKQCELHEPVGRMITTTTIGTGMQGMYEWRVVSVYRSAAGVELSDALNPARYTVTRADLESWVAPTK